MDYLLKPIRLRRLFEALSRVRTITPLSLDVLQKLTPEPRRHLSVQERGRGKPEKQGKGEKGKKEKKPDQP